MHGRKSHKAPPTLDDKLQVINICWKRISLLYERVPDRLSNPKRPVFKTHKRNIRWDQEAEFIYTYVDVIILE